MKKTRSHRTRPYQSLIPFELAIILLLILWWSRGWLVSYSKTLSWPKVDPLAWTRPKPTPPPSYDCGESYACYLIKGQADLSQFSMQESKSNLSIPVPKDWKVGTGNNFDAGFYRVVYPPYLTLDNADSGSLGFNQNGERVLSISQSDPKKTASNTEDYFFKYLAPAGGLADHSLEKNQASPSVTMRETVFASLSFTNGKKYLIAKYPHYLVLTSDIGSSLDLEAQVGVRPPFSSFSNIDYLVGDLGDTYVSIYDLKKLPREDLYGILQELELRPNHGI